MKRFLINLVTIVGLPILAWMCISIVVDYHAFHGTCGIFGEYNRFFVCNFGQYLLGGQTLPAISFGSLLWATFAIPLALLQKPLLAAFRSRRYWRGTVFAIVVLLIGTPFEIFMPIQILIMYYRW